MGITNFPFLIETGSYLRVPTSNARPRLPGLVTTTYTAIELPRKTFFLTEKHAARAARIFRRTKTPQICIFNEQKQLFLFCKPARVLSNPSMKCTVEDVRA